MNRATDLCTSVSRALAWAAGLILLATATLITLDVVFRGLLRSTYFESFELSAYAFAIATSLGFAYALTSKAHVRIEIAYNLLSTRWRAVLDVYAHACLALVAGVLTYWGGVTVLASMEIGARSNSTLAVPLALPQSLWLVGLAWFFATALVFTLAGAYALARGRAAEANLLLGVPTPETEMSQSAPEVAAAPAQAQALAETA